MLRIGNAISLKLEPLSPAYESGPIPCFVACLAAFYKERGDVMREISVQGIRF